MKTAWNPSEYSALRGALLTSQTGQWFAIILLCVTLVGGMFSSQNIVKSVLGACSIGLCAAGWLTRNQTLQNARLVAYNNQTLDLAYREILVDQLIPVRGQPVLEAAVEAKEDEPVVKFEWSDMVTNPDYYPHIMILGKTGGGKTWLAERLLAFLGGDTLVLNPHASPNSFKGFKVVGGGRDYDSIAATLQELMSEMDERYERFNKGDESYTFMNVVIDEFPAIAASTKGSVDIVKALVREARKVKIRLVILSQGAEVKTLGIEGEGSIRECFTMIRLKGFAEKFSEKECSPGVAAWVKSQDRPCLVESQIAYTSELARIQVKVPDDEAIAPQDSLSRGERVERDAERLTKMFDSSATFDELDPHLKRVIETAQKNGGEVRARQITKLASWKDYGLNERPSSDLVKSWFEELQNLGFGFITTDPKYQQSMIFKLR